MEFRVHDLRIQIQDIEFRVYEFRVWRKGLGFRVEFGHLAPEVRGDAVGGSRRILPQPHTVIQGHSRCGLAGVGFSA